MEVRSYQIFQVSSGVMTAHCMVWLGEPELPSRNPLRPTTTSFLPGSLLTADSVEQRAVRAKHASLD